MIQEKPSRPHRVCTRCLRAIPKSQKGDLCSTCLDEELFYQVKDYLAQNIATERQVAEHFSIPLQKVHNWIADGRIEYRN